MDKKVDLEMLTVGEVARVLGVSEQTIRAYVRFGQLRAVKLPGSWRIRVEDFQKFIDSISSEPVRGV